MPAFGMTRPAPRRPPSWRRFTAALVPAVAAGFLGGILGSHLIH